MAIALLVSTEAVFIPNHIRVAKPRIDPPVNRDTQIAASSGTMTYTASYLSWNSPNPISFGRPVSQTKTKELAKDTDEASAEQGPHCCLQPIYIYLAF